MKKVLLAGDSFSADWGSSYEWWKNLPYEITNISQAGSSQYKILKRLSNIDISDYDAVIIFHTSPYRIYTELNKLHLNSPTHRESCYVINDVLSNRGKMRSAMNKYIEYFYNDEYNLYCHTKVCDDIVSYASGYNVLHCSGFDYSGIYNFSNMVSAQDLHNKHKGNVCHLNQTGNLYLRDRIYQHMTLLLE